MIEFTLGLTCGIIFATLFYYFRYSKVSSVLKDKLIINSLLRKELEKKPYQKTKQQWKKTKTTKKK